MLFGTVPMTRTNRGTALTGDTGKALCRRGHWMKHQIETRCQKHNRSAKEMTRGGENRGQYTLWGKGLGEPLMHEELVHS